MISDARGGHVSPGIYTEEREVSYSVKSLGITNAAIVGETLKGPAFQPIAIESWSDFTDYFGGTSTEKYKGTLQPKYELPYLAKEYLKESKKLNVVRVLGLSGFIASKPWVITAEFDASGETKTYPVAVLRSQMSYDPDESVCITGKYELAREIVTNVEIKPYKGSAFGPNCEIIESEDLDYPLSGSVFSTTNGYKFVSVSESGDTKLGKFALEVSYSDGSETGSTMTFNVSLDPADTDYIYNVIPGNPLTNKNFPLYVESVYDYSFDGLVQESEEGTVVTLGCEGCDDNKDFREPFRCSETPWIVSQVKSASDKRIELKKLFKFYTISDGNAANYQVKISIQNIRPEEGYFDVVVRDFYDTDASPVILEKFSKCSLKEGDSSYIGLKIGTFDGSYEIKSKYITVLVNEETEGLEKCVPAGFLGYPVPKYCCDRANMYYNTKYDTAIKPKRQYFGLNEYTLDVDVLNYKGIDAYSDGNYDANPDLLTNGFHLDSILSVYKQSGSSIADATIYVDNVEGFEFSTVDANQKDVVAKRIPRILTEDYMKETIYSDINLRKFTVYTYGGFDGWDIFRTSRTNTDEFKTTKYAMPETAEKMASCPIQRISSLELDLNPTLNLDLPVNAISSDYYAYLAGYRQFANPQDIDINLFATPGIDWYNNTLLFEDAVDVIEDTEDGRGGDALYIVTTPQQRRIAEGVSVDMTEEELAEALDTLEISSSYVCTYWPWVKYFDSSDKIYINLPATKDVLRNMAYTDNKLYPWFASAGVTSRGNVDCVKAYKKTTLANEDTLYEAGINPVKTFAEDGVKIWGNKTLYTGDTPLNRVNVRRLMIRVKKLVTSASKELIFDQYDITLEKQFRAIVEPILKNVQENRGISDYRVVTECTPETRDQHILPAKILIKPIGALEYISISFVVYPESVEFDESL